DMIVNTSFKLPYFVLIIAFIPFGKMMANIFQSNIAAIIPIVLATLPVFIHHTSKSLQNTPDALLSMAITNGASKVQLIRNIILQEAKYDIIKAYGTTLIAIVSCSTIAGIVGVQGLGKLLVEKGYRNFEASYVIGIIIALALLNQVISSATNELSKK
ncbi:MAG: ABC transporter permease subunit, partial [Francisellaceae bacterium]|nr:ABC transporter permease subunit [Francisellaceae bacterium]